MKHIDKCPLCGSIKFLPFYNLGAPNRIKVTNCICADCGLVFQNPRWDFQELKQFYGKYIEETQPGIAHIPRSLEEHITAIARLRLRFLRDYLHDGDRVLDVGCSFGALLKVLRDESGRQLTVLGINPEAPVAEFGQKEYGLDIRVAMLEEMAFTPGSFDFVILDNVMEHLDNPHSSIAAIRQILSPSGRLFVATNDVNQPHGFLWQNFFPEHTVTFSSRTLKALLESEGFRLIGQDLSGHVTYEGYHYPYQYCVAVKSEKPEFYDFRLNGDNAEEQIRKAGVYMTGFLKDNRTAKKLYEAGIEDGQETRRIRVRRRLNTLVAKFIGAKEFTLANHTLPPEEYVYRRLLVAFCGTEKDISTVISLAEKSGLNPLLFVIRSGPRDFLLHTYPRSGLTSEPAVRFRDEESFWSWLFSGVRRIDELIVMRLNAADLDEEALKRSHEDFRKSGKTHSFVTYREFTEAQWEIFTGPELHTALSDGSPRRLSAKGKEKNSMALAWPGKEDCAYYFKKLFKPYFERPQAVALDLSPACNKRCGKCQFHSPASPFSSIIARGEMMSLDTALRVLDEIATWPSRPTISPNYSGEPLIYPHLKPVILRARQHGLPLGLTTNGLALNEDWARFLLEAQIESLLVSIDAFSDQLYAELQPPGNLSQVRENLLRFLEMRGSKKKPAVGVHFVMEARNREEFTPFLDFWGKRVDFVSTAIYQDQFDACQLALKPWYPLHGRQACWAAWTTLYIRWDGKISFCGFDVEGNRSGLRIFEKPLLEIWNSDEFWHWREAQLNNDRSILYCRACPDWAGRRVVHVKEERWSIQRSPFTEIYTRNNG